MPITHTRISARIPTSAASGPKRWPRPVPIAVRPLPAVPSVSLAGFCAAQCRGGIDDVLLGADAEVDYLAGLGHVVGQLFIVAGAGVIQRLLDIRQAGDDLLVGLAEQLNGLREGIAQGADFLAAAGDVVAQFAQLLALFLNQGVEAFADAGQGFAGAADQGIYRLPLTVSGAALVLQQSVQFLNQSLAFLQQLVFPLAVAGRSEEHTSELQSRPHL